MAKLLPQRNLQPGVNIVGAEALEPGLRMNAAPAEQWGL